MCVCVCVCEIEREKVCVFYFYSSYFTYPNVCGVGVSVFVCA